MRLTSPLQHGKKFWWGKGWGQKPRTNTDQFYWRKQWRDKSKVPIETIQQVLPPGVTPIDMNAYVKAEFSKETRAPIENFTLPWPYSPRPVKGFPGDPGYQTEEAYVFQRNKRLVEAINLPLQFSNAVLETGLPPHLQKLLDTVNIDDEFESFAQRRIRWCLANDAALRKLPLDREFPYIDQDPPRVWGITSNRKENHLLHSLYELSNTWLTKRYGFNCEILRQKVSNPYCVLPLTRADKSVILDLECDFITLLSPLKSQSQVAIAPFDGNYTVTTADQSLASIHPLSWEAAFDKRNIYKTGYDFTLPANASIQNIFLSNNNVRTLKDENFQGRAIMFAYGFALQQAKLQSGADDIEGIQLERPLSISCVYTSQRFADTVGYILFQLNTTKAEDGLVRNQVWISEPKSVLENTKHVLADLITVQSLGIYN